MSKIFVTSDAHFGHRNIIQYCGRPFKKTADMNEAMIERWNSRVGFADTVFFLGDFAMGPKVNDDFVAEVLGRLNGKIRIIRGNHDQPAKKYGMSGLRRVVYEHFLMSDDTEPRITILSDIHEETIDGTHFIMCHYPMNDWNGKYHGSVHLHGHKHNGFSPSRAREQAEKKRYDVGVDMYGGPVEITGDLRYLDNPEGWK